MLLMDFVVLALVEGLILVLHVNVSDEIERLGLVDDENVNVSDIVSERDRVPEKLSEPLADADPDKDNESEMEYDEDTDGLWEAVLLDVNVSVGDDDSDDDRVRDTEVDMLCVLDGV